MSKGVIESIYTSQKGESFFSSMSLFDSMYSILLYYYF